MGGALIPLPVYRFPPLVLIIVHSATGLPHHPRARHWARPEGGLHG